MIFYGAIPYLVAHCTREFGIRIALGTAARAAARRRGTGYTAIGAAIGLLVAAAGVDRIQSLLCEVNACDPMTFAVAAATIVVAALFAAYAPARRAASADPLIVLRAG